MREVGRNVELVDPQRIAEDIINMRSEVAKEWKEIVTTIPQEHTGLRKALYAKHMSKYDTQPKIEKAAPGGFE
jgi:Tfp pilus assembly PilM family ATPase